MKQQFDRGFALSHLLAASLSLEVRGLVFVGLLLLVSCLMPSQLAVSLTLSGTVSQHIEQPIVTQNLHDDASLSHQLRTMSEL